MRRKHLQGFVFIAALVAGCHFSLTAQNMLAPYRQGQYWGLANAETGKIIVPPTLDSVGFFQFNGDAHPLAWIKKGGRYGLINRLGEVVLPIAERIQGPVSMVAKDFYSVERFAWGTSSEEEEAANPEVLSREFLFRPVAFFDKNGRALGQPFVFQTRVDLLSEGGVWEDPNGFDSQVDSSYWTGQVLQEIWQNGKAGLFDLEKGRPVVQPGWNAISAIGHLVIARQWTGTTSEEANDFHTTLIDLTGGTTNRVPDSIEIAYEQGSTALLLAKNKATGRWGFVDETGMTAIPFRYLQANPFSKNGWTKVLSTDNQWSMIDLSGREVMALGQSNGYQRWADGSVWIQSGTDQLFYRKDAKVTDRLGRFGFDQPPTRIKYGARQFWQGQRFGKTGLLDSVGQVALPFEFNDVSLGIAATNQQLPGTLLENQFLKVSKNNRTWFFDSRSLQPLWPKIIPANGLTLGKTFDQSNFELVQVLSGDSLFAIKLTDGSMDVLNARNGRRWGITNAASVHIISGANGAEPIVYCNQPNGAESRFNLHGQAVLFTTEVFGENIPGPGYCRAGVDPETGLTHIFDGTGRLLCQFHSPFQEAGSRILIEKNEDGRLFPYVFIVTSAKGESAVFSPAGSLLSPPDTWEPKVYRDMLQLSCDPAQVTRMGGLMTIYQKKGLYRLADGTEILPCQYAWIDVRDEKLLAQTVEGLLYRFDFDGKMRGLYPPGYGFSGAFSEGLQVVVSDRDANYVDEQLNLILPPGQILQGRPFSEGVAAVRTPAGWKYIQPTGKPALEGAYLYAESFLNGHAIVRTKDGWTSVIDHDGQSIFTVPSSPDPETMALSRVGKSYILQRDVVGEHLVSLEGKVILPEFDYFPQAQEEPNDTVRFFSGEKLGYLLPAGQIRWVEPSDFILEKNEEKGQRYILKGFGCPVEALMKTGSHEWIIPPRICQTIFAADYQGPIVFVWDKNFQNRTVVNRNTGQIVPVLPGNLQKLEGDLGWLLLNTETATSWLYSPDFMTKRPWNYRYQNISWDENLGLFRVNELEGNTIGFISRNGRILFEN